MIYTKELSTVSLFEEATSIFCKTGEKSFIVCSSIEDLFRLKEDVKASTLGAIDFEIPEDKPVALEIGGYKFALITSHCVAEGLFILK